MNHTLTTGTADVERVRDLIASLAAVSDEIEADEREVELMAATAPEGSQRDELERTLRVKRHPLPQPAPNAPPAAPAPVRTSRPRGRRARHVARATSSADSGDSEPEPPGPGKVSITGAARLISEGQQLELGDGSWRWPR